MRKVTIKDFAKLYAETNQGMNPKEIVNELELISKDKKNGTTCECCGGEIWVVGAFLMGYKSCHYCMTNETESSSDFEVE